jgi:uncharacterized membrane protein (DUF373 family)
LAQTGLFCVAVSEPHDFPAIELLMQFLNDNRFLSAIHGYERFLAKLLALLLAIVVGMGTLELFSDAISKMISLQTDWFDGGLIKLLDRLLLIFIALEVLQNITAYLRDHVVQIELVLLTALTAVARKVIVLPPGAENKPALMAGFGVIVIGIATAYWLVLMARRGNPPAPSND